MSTGGKVKRFIQQVHFNKWPRTGWKIDGNDNQRNVVTWKKGLIRVRDKMNVLDHNEGQT
jgi:hypothetical protein